MKSCFACTYESNENVGSSIDSSLSLNIRFLKTKRVCMVGRLLGVASDFILRMSASASTRKLASPASWCSSESNASFTSGAILPKNLRTVKMEKVL